MNLSDAISTLVENATYSITQAPNLLELEKVRNEYLGRNGKLKDLMNKITEVTKEEKKIVGQQLNQAKNNLDALLQERKNLLSLVTPKKETLIDPTLPGIKYPVGSKHPLTQATERFTSIFEKLGFTIVDGPEIEDRFHNFDALNIPEDHPVREVADTFVLEENAILRSQTSTVQIRVMEKHVLKYGGKENMPALRIVAPGRTFRPDTVDATHHYGFSQIEGLAVDKDITFSDLRGILSLFAKEMFGSKTKIRFRPSFFSFTEPSAELDISCIFCAGRGCRVCKKQGWVELGGCGMVDPNVFQAVGVDSEIFTGFAFGFGIERVAMFMLGIDDIRRFTENDLRFLRQF